MAKSAEAFRTISEVAEWLGVQTHVLRFWESKFTQVKPLKRAGGRRYYRPSDMALLGGIKRLLHDDGMTIKGAQKILRERGVKEVAAMCPLPLDGIEMPDEPAPEAVPRATPSRQTSVAETAPLPRVAPSKDAPELDLGPPVSRAPAAPSPAPTAAPKEDSVAPVDADTPKVAAPEPEPPAPRRPGGDTVPPTTLPPMPGIAGTPTPTPANVSPPAAEAKPPAPKSAPKDDPPVGLPSFMRKPERQTTLPPPTSPPPMAGVTSPVTPPAPTAAPPQPEAPKGAWPARGTPIAEALAQISPGQIDPGKLRPIYDKLVALRGRMDA